MYTDDLGQIIDSYYHSILVFPGNSGYITY